MKLLNTKITKSKQYINIENSLNSLVEDGYIEGWKDLKITKDKITFAIKPIYLEHFVINYNETFGAIFGMETKNTVCCPGKYCMLPRM
jgi:hypothetical protein